MADASRGSVLRSGGRFNGDKGLEAMPVKDVDYEYEEVDFSQNGLSTVGLKKVLDLCMKCAKLRVLKLYKNEFDDDGAELLSNFIPKCDRLEEIHLSHNHFTARGVEALVKAAAQKRPAGMNPLWLRVEQNDVVEPDRVFKDLKSQYSVCKPRKYDPQCTVRNCKNDCKVHLPHFYIQRGSNEEQHQDRGRKRHRDWEEEAWKDQGDYWTAPRGGGKGGGKDYGKDYRDEYRGGKGGGKDYGKDYRDDYRGGEKGGGKHGRKSRRDEEEQDAGEPKPDHAAPKAGGGLFARALGVAGRAALGRGEKLAVLKEGPDAEKPDVDLDAPDEEGEDDRKKVEPSKAAGNVASRTLSRLGVLTEGRKKIKVTLTEAPGADADAEDQPQERTVRRVRRVRAPEEPERVRSPRPMRRQRPDSPSPKRRASPPRKRSPPQRAGAPRMGNREARRAVVQPRRSPDGQDALPLRREVPRRAGSRSRSPRQAVRQPRRQHSAGRSMSKLRRVRTARPRCTEAAVERRGSRSLENDRAQKLRDRLSRDEPMEPKSREENVDGRRTLQHVVAERAKRAAERRLAEPPVARDAKGEVLAARPKGAPKRAAEPQKRHDPKPAAPPPRGQAQAPAGDEDEYTDDSYYSDEEAVAPAPKAPAPAKMVAKKASAPPPPVQAPAPAGNDDDYSYTYEDEEEEVEA